MKKALSLIVLGALMGCATVERSSSLPIKDKTKQISKTQEKAELFLSIGQSLERHGRLTEATKNYQLALKQESRMPEAYFALGKILLKRKFKRKGLKAINHATKLNPKYTEALNFLAYYHHSKKHYGPAYSFINKSAQDLVYRDQERIWALKFKLDQKFLSKKAALVSGGRAMTTPPQNCSHRTMMAYTWVKLNQSKKALKAARQAEPLCSPGVEQDRVAFIKSLSFAKRGELLVAKNLIEGIQTEDKTLRTQIPALMTSINKKIKKKPGL